MDSYGSLCTEFYDLDKPVAPADALDYYLARAREAKGRVLEPMCGSGRFLLPMLRAELPIDGVDPSRAMLEACRARAVRDGLKPTLYEQSLECLSVPSRYSLAFIPSGSIGLIAKDEDLRSALSRLRQHLIPGGRLLLELVNPAAEDVTEERCDPRVVRCSSGATITYECRVSRRHSPESLVFAGTYEKRHQGKLVAREEETIILRQHHASDMLSLLADSGFDDANVTSTTSLPWLAASGCFLVDGRAGG